jgi:hypothetical protein
MNREAVHPDPKNRRSEKRFEADEPLLLSFDDPVPQQLRATLTDYSASGFRARHEYPNLETGQVVRFERSAAHGAAKVVWNRISAGKVETGFVLIQP